MGCCCDRRVVFGGSGLLFIIIASVMYPLIDMVTVSELEKSNVMKNGTILYENLRNPSPLVLYEFYFWSLENGDDYLSGGNDVKLKFSQKGPYTYIEKYGRDEIEQENGEYEDSSYYAFRQTRLFTWSEEHSCADCSKHDKPNTANIVGNAVHGIVTDISRKRGWGHRNVTIVCAKAATGPTADCEAASEEPTACGKTKECFPSNLEDWLMIIADDVFVRAGSKLYDGEKTVDEILFGFEDEIFKKLGENFAERAQDALVLGDIFKELSNVFTDLTYGIFKPKNGTADGTPEDAGAAWDHFKNRNGNGQNCLDGRTTCAYRVNEILEWEGKTDLSPWYGEDKISYCNKIEGTDGQSIYTDTRKEDTLTFFISDLCRSVYMIPADVTVNLEGDGYKIPSVVWYGPPDVFWTKSRSEHRCFCSPNLPEGWCENYDGLHMMDQCQMGAPVIATGPHFSGGSDRWTDDIEGMTPDNTPGFEWGNAEHTSFNGYDLNSGAITFNSKKIQINFLVKRDDRITFMSNVKNEDAVVWPIFWSNETMKLDDDTARSLYEASVKPMKIGTSLQYTMFALGGFLILIAIVEHFRAQRRQVDSPEKSESAVEDPFKTTDDKSVSM